MADQNNAPAPEAEDEDGVWKEAVAHATGQKAEAAPAPEEPPQNEPAADSHDPEAAADPAPAEDQDPWATAPEALRKAYEEAQERAEKAERAERSTRGRVIAYERQLRELRQRDEQQPKPEAPQQAAPAGDGEQPALNAKQQRRFDQMKEEYPEIAEAIVEEFAARDASMQEMRNALSEIQLERQSAIEAQLAQEADRLEQEHPGYRQFIGERRDEFVAWVRDQPHAIREAAARNELDVWDAAEAASVIAAFKQHLGAEAPRQPDAPAASTNALAERRARQMRGASGVRTATRPAASGLPAEGDPEIMARQIFAEVEKKHART